MNNPTDQQHTGPHLMQQLAVDLLHATRHGQRLTDDDVAGDAQATIDNAEHLQHHHRELAGGLLKLTDWLKTTASDPEAFSAELEQLKPVVPPPAAVPPRAAF